MAEHTIFIQLVETAHMVVAVARRALINIGVFVVVLNRLAIIKTSILSLMPTNGMITGLTNLA